MRANPARIGWRRQRGRARPARPNCTDAVKSSDEKAVAAFAVYPCLQDTAPCRPRHAAKIGHIIQRSMPNSSPPAPQKVALRITDHTLAITQTTILGCVLAMTGAIYGSITTRIDRLELAAQNLSIQLAETRAVLNQMEKRGH